MLGIEVDQLNTTILETSVDGTISWVESQTKRSIREEERVQDQALEVIPDDARVVCRCRDSNIHST